MLIQKGANILAVDSDGLTPALSCAPSKNVAQCLNIILSHYPSSTESTLHKGDDDDGGGVAVVVVVAVGRTVAILNLKKKNMYY